MKFSSLCRLVFGTAVILSLASLVGCGESVFKTQAQRDAEMLAQEKAAAEAGNVFAEYRYGSYLLAEKQDPVGALVWFQKAAQAGDRWAQEKLAGYYYWGRGGLPKDYAVAASWMRKSAEQGNDSAQYSLATMYAEGVGVPKDKARQIEWLEKAAWQYNRAALNDLTRVGDPHGVVRQVAAKRDADLDEMSARVRAEQLRQAVQQQNAQPAQQRMCSMNNGQVTYQVPC